MGRFRAWPFPAPSALIVLWAAAIAHVFAGGIDYGLAGRLLIGAIPGILLSTHISPQAPQGVIRGALGPSAATSH